MSTVNAGVSVRVFPGAEEVAAALAVDFVELVQRCLAGCSRFSVALSGGQTPRRLLEILAQYHADQIPWGKLHLFWGDDRFVPPEDRYSNYRMVREALLDRVPAPQSNVHPMPTFFRDPVEAAAEYEATLKETFHGNWPRLDLALQGLGPDGHTASLFPHSPALGERDRWVMAVEGPTEPRRRLTLTLPVLNHAARVWFLVTGEEKAEAVARALAPETSAEECPAAGVRPDNGEVIWWLDQAAAGGVCEAGGAAD